MQGKLPVDAFDIRVGIVNVFAAVDGVERFFDDRRELVITNRRAIIEVFKSRRKCRQLILADKRVENNKKDLLKIKKSNSLLMLLIRLKSCTSRDGDNGFDATPQNSCRQDGDLTVF